MATKVRSFRLSDETMEKLQALVDDYNNQPLVTVQMTPAKMIEWLIALEYEMLKRSGRI
jgi:predicted DNA-binding protein